MGKQKSLEQLQQEMSAMQAALGKLSSAIERRNTRLATTKTTTSADGSKQWKTVTVNESDREITIYKARANGWVFFEAKEMPNDKVELRFWKKVDSTQVDGIDKTVHAAITKTVQANNRNVSPALVQQKISQAIDTFKSTGVMPQPTKDAPMGTTHTVEIPLDQKNATIDAYKKSNWQYLSENHNPDTGIVRVTFQKL